jgi:hypothetical protein
MGPEQLILQSRKEPACIPLWTIRLR